MSKMNQSNKQLAFEYALYMIASSYYDKAQCKNKLLEEKMLLYYKEQKLDVQYDMEDACIAWMDNLASRLSPQFFREAVAVHFQKLEDGTTAICLVGEKSVLKVFGVYKGKKPKLEYRLTPRG